MTIHTMWNEVNQPLEIVPPLVGEGSRGPPELLVNQHTWFSRVCHLCRCGVSTWEVPGQRQGCCRPWHSYPQSGAPHYSLGWAVTEWQLGGTSGCLYSNLLPKTGPALSCQKSGMDREPTPSLGTPLSNFPHNEKVFTLYSVRIYLISIYYHCVLFSRCALLHKNSLHLLNSVPVGTQRERMRCCC